MQLLFELVFRQFSKVFDAQLTRVHAAKDVAEQTRYNSQAVVSIGLKNKIIRDKYSPRPVIFNQWAMVFTGSVLYLGVIWSELKKFFLTTHFYILSGQHP